MHARGDGDALGVGGAGVPKVRQRLFGCAAEARVQQVRRNHEAGAAFAGFAVDGDDVVFVFGQPVVDAGTEVGNHIQRARVVVVEGEPLGPPFKL